jgi:hypothetical protein
VLPGQLDRLHAVLRRPRKRPVELGDHLVRQAGELEIRPPDPSRQRDALLQVRLGLVEPDRPDLGDAEADKCQRAQFLAQAGLRRVLGLGQGLQPLRLFGHRRQVPALPGQQQSDDPEQHLELSAPPGWHRRRSPLGQPQVAFRRLQRPPGQLIGCGHRRQFDVRRAGFGGEPGQQRVHGGGLPVQMQAGPVVSQQPSGPPPVLRGLGMADRLHAEPAFGQPGRGQLVQRGDLTRPGTSQLQLQQVSE